jgi:cytochrome c peroxidase
MKKAAVIIVLSLSIFACKDVVNSIPEVPMGTTAYTFSYNENQLPPPRVPADNPLTKEGVFLGRMLFYDPILSSDSSQSCASCHNQTHAFTDNGKQFSTGVLKTVGKRNSMPIFNLMWHLDGFFWDGRADILKHQAIMPIIDPTEMNETAASVLAKLNNSPLYKERFLKAYAATEVTEELLGKALEQFMLSIVSGGSKFDKVEMGLATFTNEEKIGQIIFNSEAITIDKEIDPNNPQNYGADCFHCHGNSLFMRREYLSNGLPTSGDRGKGGFNQVAEDDYKFKTPSLRNIEKTAPYMHDGRFNTLEEVVQFYLSPIKNSPIDIANSPNMHALKDSMYLSPAHKAALVSFLKTLTDEELLTKEEYSNPFK